MNPAASTANDNLRRWQRRYAIGGGLVFVWIILFSIGHGGGTHDVEVELHTAVPNTAISTQRTSSSVASATTTAAPHAGATAHDDSSKAGGSEHTSAAGSGSHYLVQPLLPRPVLDLLESASMIDVMNDTAVNKACPWSEKESKSNVDFMRVWSELLRNKFPPSAGGQKDGSGLLWFLDEGGLIGSSRAGAMANADDDFDFFLILPNQHAPCRPDSITCTDAEFHAYIHKFLMTFWDAGMCINKFHPNIKKFKSKNRLMYSFQLGRPANHDPDVESCFIESKPFAHMHLAMFTREGKLKTNIWAVGTTHPMDELDLSIMLPVRRCRAGPVDAPCPNNITAFLTVRNRGEYRSRSGDGNCLLVRKKWGEARKIGAVKLARKLSACGYNSIVDLADAFEASGYRSC